MARSRELRDGDIIRLDARAGVLEAQVDAATLQARESVKPEVFDATYGVGRELFTRLREGASPRTKARRSSRGRQGTGL